MAARLHSAENVRDFLMSKLKDLEDQLASTIETSAKKDEQAALDREIIGFLDARNQEYEIVVKKCAKQNEEYRADLARLEEEHTAKTSVGSSGHLDTIVLWVTWSDVLVCRCCECTRLCRTWCSF